MTIKTKSALSILFMSVSFFMMITTRYTHALGDYILELIGLPSWTGDHTGFHLTIIYFGVLFIIGLFMVLFSLYRRKESVFFIFGMFAMLISVRALFSVPFYYTLILDY